MSGFQTLLSGFQARSLSQLRQGRRRRRRKKGRGTMKREGNYPQCVSTLQPRKTQTHSPVSLSFFLSYFFGRVSTCAAGFPLAQPKLYL